MLHRQPSTKHSSDISETPLANTAASQLFLRRASGINEVYSCGLIRLIASIRVSLSRNIVISSYPAGVSWGTQEREAEAPKARSCFMGRMEDPEPERRPRQATQRVRRPQGA
jgi:hypothetical protein